MTQAPNNQIRWRVGRRALYVIFNGPAELTLPSPQMLVEAAMQEQKPLLVLDLTRAEGVNNPLLQWIEQISAMAEGSGIRVRVVAQAGSRLRWLLDMLRFSRFVLVLGSVREAVKFGRGNARTQL